MDDLKFKLAELRHRIDALSLRERGFVLAALLTAILALWNSLMQSPISLENQRLKAELAQIEMRSLALLSARDGILARAKLDPNQGVRDQQLRLNTELNELESRREQLAKSFLSPRSTAELLHNMLKARSSLRLISLKSVPPQALLAREPAAKDQSSEHDSQPMIYRHDLVVEFEGGFFDMLEYLRVLEGQPLFWDSIDYQVTAYPGATVRLRVFTLSFEKEWLGV